MRVRFTFVFALVLMLGAGEPDASADNGVAGAAMDEPGVVYSEIHCKNFLFGCPMGEEAGPFGSSWSNDLIIRDIYALCNNGDTKFADWVAYRLTPEVIQGDVRTSRSWRADPWLDDAETLEPEDYTGANSELGTDRGHQAPLAAFKGTESWRETNHLSNITPQVANLNQGVWVRLEAAVRDLVDDVGEVYVYTGPLYDEPMAELPGADETHCVPSGYWKLVMVPCPGEEWPVEVAAFICDQQAPRPSRSELYPFLDYVCNVDEIEARTGLDFLHELPDDIEELIEGEVIEDLPVEELWAWPAD